MVLYLLFQPLPESKFQRVNIRNIGEIIKKHYCFGEISEFSLYLSPQKFSVMLTLDKIYQASFALKTVIRRTDLISAPNINPDSHIYLKPENLQITGSFKVRASTGPPPAAKTINF